MSFGMTVVATNIPSNTHINEATTQQVAPTRSICVQSDRMKANYKNKAILGFILSAATQS